MAENMQDIKRRIKSINSTERITNAMKLVSASKLRKAKAAFTNSQVYLNRVIDNISETLESAEDIPRELLFGGREIKTSCYVLITSSKGLCGSFNNNVIKTMEETIEKAHTETKIVAIGSKGHEYFQRHGYDIIMSHDAPVDTVTFEETKEISSPLIEMYKSGEIDEIVLVYTSYVNTLKQEVVVKRLMPFDPALLTKSGEYNREIEYYPSTRDVFRYLVPKYIELMIFGRAIESATCEYAARRQSMETANDNAKDMLSELQVYYNRARQAEITDEIIEIVAGSEAQR